MDEEEKTEAIVNGLLPQVKGMPGRQRKCLRPFVRALVKNPRPMTALELAHLPDIREMSMTTIYRMIGKLDDAGLLRRQSNGARADLLVINLPENPRCYLICSTCGDTVELPYPESLEQLSSECSHNTGWSAVKLDVHLSGLCPACQAVS